MVKYYSEKLISFIKNPPRRPKIQEKPPALKREQPALQNKIFF
jgi:hypothetical protein